MLKKLLVAVVVLFGLTTGAQAYTDQDGNELIVVSSTLRLDSDFIDVDGWYEGSPRLGGGVMSVILELEAIGPNGLATYYLNVSSEATYTISDTSIYPLNAYTLKSYGLEVSNLYVLAAEGAVAVDAEYDGMTAQYGVIFIRPQSYLTNGVGYGLGNLIVYWGGGSWLYDYTDTSSP